MLINWKTYIQMIGQIREITTSGATEGRRNIALAARKHLSPLDASGFFAVYPSLDIERLEIDKNINFLVHNTKKHLDRSALKYFKERHPDEEIRLQDKSKDSAGIHVCNYCLLCDYPYVFFSSVYLSL